MDKRPGTGRELKNLFREALIANNPPEEAEAMAFWAAEEISGLTRTDIIAEKPLLMDDTAWEKTLAVAKRLRDNEPVQYIFGRAWFRGMEFKVNQNVLIPRPETEELVELILNENPGSSARVLDIGTGSGCIPVALATERPRWEISTIDISESALELAAINADLNEVEITFISGDILNEPIPGKFDIIVSNPPYVPESEKPDLHQRVTQYEPGLALYTPDKDPLLFYRVIAEKAAKSLLPGGKIYFEIEEKRGDDVTNLLESNGWKNVRSVRDINQKERIISAVIS